MSRKDTFFLSLLHSDHLHSTLFCLPTYFLQYKPYPQARRTSNKFYIIFSMRLLQLAALSLLLWLSDIVNAFNFDEVQGATPRLQPRRHQEVDVLAFTRAKGNVRALLARMIIWALADRSLSVPKD